ncbi:MAG: hypothetical protein AAFM92_03890 [Pseudomonadota bacterium]
MIDPFKGTQSGLTVPATDLVTITPDDASDLPYVLRAISVNTSGSVRVTALDGSEATIFVAAGAPFPARVTRVWDTGTTATGIVGLI